jgi:hypothetical protein
MRWLCPGMGVNSQFMANKKYQKHGRVNQWILGYPSFELKPYQKTIRRKSRKFQDFWHHIIFHDISIVF